MVGPLKNFFFFAASLRDFISNFKDCQLSLARILSIKINFLKPFLIINNLLFNYILNNNKKNPYWCNLNSTEDFHTSALIEIELICIRSKYAEMYGSSGINENNWRSDIHLEMYLVQLYSKNIRDKQFRAEGNESETRRWPSELV